MLALPFTTWSREADRRASRECVVLIHGLGRTSQSMKRLEWGLTQRGYEVINVSYPSRRFAIDLLVEDYLHPAIGTKAANPHCKLHFVTHSMGGILLRHYLATHPIQNLGRSVMLAPPNRGSEVVDRLKTGALGQWILGPAGCELDTSAYGLPNRLGAVGFDVGIIAGNRSWNPWFSCLLSGPDDGKVSVASARVEGMRAFLVVPNSHTWMPWRSKTVSHVLSYLQTGRFISESRGTTTSTT